MDNARRNYFIDKEFQTKFILKFCALVILMSLATAFLTVNLVGESTTVGFENTRVVVKSTRDFIIPVIAQTMVMISLASAAAMAVMTLLVSHRIAGPLYRFKKEVEQIKSGDLTPQFKIRGQDQLQVLAVSLSEMTESLRARHIDLMGRVAKLKVSLQGQSAQAFAAVADIEKILNELKV